MAKMKNLIRESFRPVDVSAEMEYTEFYCDVLKSIFDFENTHLEKKYEQSLNTRVRIESLEGLLKTPTCLIQYYTKESRCAYIYRYSVLHSMMVSFHFTNFLMESVGLTKKFLKQKPLTICCLGGGPPLEAVAIIKVLNDLMVNMSLICLTDIHVIIVDKCSVWKEDCLAILESMKETSSLGISKDINISVEFIKADLLMEIDDDLMKRIKEADIVTMVKFVSELQKLLPENTSKRIREMIMNVARNMNEKGCFFMVDDAGDEIPTKFRSVFHITLKWLKIYGPLSKKPPAHHALQDGTIRIFEDLLPGSRCSKETVVYSYVWKKKSRKKRLIKN